MKVARLAAVGLGLLSLLWGAVAWGKPSRPDGRDATALAPVDLASAATRLDALEALPRFPVVLGALEIRGLWRTHREIVEDELPFRVGGQVTEDSYRLGLARLWNLGVFSRVEARWSVRQGRAVLGLDLEERWTINPLFSFQATVRRNAGASESSSWWSVGLADTNVAGRLVEAAGRFEQFDRYSGGQLFVRDQRLLGRRLEGLLLWEWLVRPRPGFADRRMTVRAEVNRRFRDDRILVGGRVEWLMDRFFDLGDGSSSALPDSSETGQSEFIVRWGRVDTRRLRQTGLSIELRPALGLTWRRADDVLVHGKITAEIKVFKEIYSRFNFALRGLAGTTWRAPSHLAMYLGGLYEVRGVRDSYVRADRYALANLEGRYVAFDSTYFALMPAAFADAAVARDLDRGWVGLVSVGAGVRLLVPRFVRTGLRIDLAIPVRGIPCAGDGICQSLSVGVFQFF